MSSTIRIPGYRKLLLPAALSLAMLSLSAHAGESWVSTNTHAAIQKSATANVSTLVMTGHPTVEATQIAPLEQSKPLHVVVTLNQRNAQQLQAFLHDVNTAGSPSYHKYLTPAQFKAQYAPSDAQVQAVVAHLQKYGFKNIEVAPNNALVSADGTGMSVNAAFNTSVQTFSFQGKQHFANSSDAMVPQALSGIVNSVQGLQDVVTAHVMSHILLPSRADGAAVTNVKAAGTQAAAAQAPHSPVDLGKIYNADSLAAASNTTVGIIGWYDMAPTIADLKTFTTNAGLPTVATQMVKTGSGTYQTPDINTQAEWNLDSQSIIGLAGGVKQLNFYTAPNAQLSSITAAYNKAVTDNVAKVINVSLGVDETAAKNGGSQSADDQIFAQAVAQGQTFSVASGDAGVYQWSSDNQGIGYVANSAGQVQIDLTHLSVSEPTASPNVVSVGGTALSTNGTTWAGETVWNEGLSAISTTDANQRLWAEGGGVSLFEAAPAWQKAALGSSVTKRQVPDVVFDAAQATGANILIQGKTYTVGGTSLASPIFVGIWARIESANGNSLGLPTENFYTYFPKDSAPLHDVTSGNNGYQNHGYTAAAGYDIATGWGSLDAAKLSAYVTKYWGGGTTPPPTGGAPVANFTDTVSGLAVSFTNSSTDTGGTINAYAWSFGDGGTSTTASPSHTYAAAGTYTVSLKVTDSTGATNTKSQQVTVSAGGSTGGNVFSNTTPVAIGDNATITSSIAVSGIAGNASKTLKIHASITHNKSGDLQVKIIAPNGASAVLKSPTYSGGSNIDTTWTVDASGVAANGTWKLQVVDYDLFRSGDKGTLNNWNLTF
ncbi:protease pro-enzyme activation domain-containing protein [Rhodanobacter sp. Col0626]|uniref:protease pro-enzyme activation domain-containing protein n=1 Tax=Rhodanobacter sp. Col0626 TaxID=3415679 RepID=UPI003CF434FE